MHGSELDPGVTQGLGVYFLLLALMNAYYALAQVKKHKGVFSEEDQPASRTAGIGVWLGFWVVLTVFLLGISFDFFRGQGLVLAEGFRDSVDNLMGPVVYFILSVVAFAGLIYYRKVFSSNLFGWLLLDGTLIFTGISMTDADFRAIVAKPDNVPISMLILSVGFTTWLALKMAVQNDERASRGEQPVEAEGKEKVLTWPDLVYTELLAMVVCTVFLLIWSIFLLAPLEPPASTTKIPNPSKAPWYFLGLQEMLVYFDPWLAGVVLPTYIIIGLCAIPYIDYNKKGNGYYTYAERPFAIVTFLFGFLVLWVTLIVLGTFLRGPNWNFFGFYETWTPYKTVALNNINLSDILWINFLGTARPDFWLAREFLGILLVLGYFLVTPLVMAKTVFRNMYVKMGFIRYMVMANILLMMAFLPLKMVLRWTFNLKYIIYIPEFFFNV